MNDELIVALERLLHWARFYGLDDTAERKHLAVVNAHITDLQNGGERAKVVAIPHDLARVIVGIGKAEWGTTEAHNAEGHGAHISESVRITAEHFGQDGPQMMHGLYIEGSQTVICHTGTSPNSPQIARALTGAWNRLFDEAQDAIEAGAHMGGENG